MEKVPVIAVGVINMTTGMTKYDWSIYENKGCHAFLAYNGYLLLGAKGTFKIGDEAELYDNDSRRKLGKSARIVDTAPCTKEELLQMLKKNGYDYTPIKAFRARAKGNRKLSTSYSVK